MLAHGKAAGKVDGKIREAAPGADGQPVERFAGADGKARELIGAIDPHYLPWFEPLLEPASGEISSLLFVLQAAQGAGFIAYYLVGVSATRERMRREAARLAGEQALAD